MTRFRLRLKTVLARVKRDWSWFFGRDGGRKRLGMLSPRGNRYWFSSTTNGTFLTPIRKPRKPHARPAQ